MSAKRVDLFNQMVGYIFADLHDAFPFPASPDVVVIAKSMNATPGMFFNSDEPHWTGATLSNGDLVGHFMDEVFTSLLEEGFLRRVYRGNDCYVLTAKAFAALSTTPTGLAEQKSLGSALSEAAKTSGKEAGKAVISDLAVKVVNAGTQLILGKMVGGIAP